MHDSNKANVIEVRAYFLWEQAGRPLGRSQEFWLRAEAELAAESGEPSTRSARAVKKAVTAPKKPAAAKKTATVAKTTAMPKSNAPEQSVASKTVTPLHKSGEHGGRSS